MADKPNPLNGTKTHPLSAFAKFALSTLRVAPRPKQEINSGVVDRLCREGLVEIVSKESPYKTHKGKKIAFLQITNAGRDALND